MALKVPKFGLPQLLKEGYKSYQGLDEAVYRNIEACKQLADVTRTSIGPSGMNKMVINHLEKLFVTNDAGTIIRELEVVHPAAKLLVQSSQAQDFEIGDATNLVVVLAGELLAKAEHLLRMGLHPSDVVDGFDTAGKKILEILEELTVATITDLRQEDQVLKAVVPAICSKQHGYEDLLAGLVTKAIDVVMPPNPKNFVVDSVRVVKVLGASIHESTVVKGMVFGREAEGTITTASKAKIALFTCALDVQHTETKGTVLIHNAKEMLNFSKGEEKLLEAQIKEIADAGVKVVVSGSGIGELALHFCNRFDIMVVKILSKFDLRRLGKVVGATPLARLGAPTAEEVGYCDVVETVEIGGDRCTVFRQENESTRTATIVLRGGTPNFLDDLERAVDDGCNVVKALAKDGRLVAGAGACELELARRLTQVGEKTPGLRQYGIKAYAEALEVIPRTLGQNAGFDGTDIISTLYAAHSAPSNNPNIGVNVDDAENPILDSVKEGILDSLLSKHWAIKYATEAALTVLRIDQIIMSKPAGGPKMPKGMAVDDD